MWRWLSKNRRFHAFAFGSALLPVAAGSVQAQLFHPRAKPDCSQPCPCPTPSVLPMPAAPAAPGTPTPPSTTTPTPPSDTQPAPAPTPFDTGLTPEASAAVGGESYASAAPNMLGHLLFGSRSINFRYNRASGPINVRDNGSTSLVNAAVADDNSPLPRDRVGFRYNFFDNAQQVTGFGNASTLVNGVPTATARVRDYDVHQYTFNIEKTFLDRLASVELRVPFTTGLSSRLDLSAGNIVGPADAAGNFPVVATPQNSLGREGTQFGNMSVILKGLLHQTSTLAVSGGLGIGIPTGDDTTVRITDYSGFVDRSDANIQRLRQIRINNEIWSLSPFLAVLYTPNDRVFTQGFVQFDFPLNTSSINYSETTPRGTLNSIAAFESFGGVRRFPTLETPFTARANIREQALMQLDWGTGFWLFRDPERTWITGIAPTLELHYTTTLQRSSIVTLPADTLTQIDPNNSSNSIQEQPPRVGSLRNRVDILDMTVGSTFLLSDRATLATGLSFPLKRASDRTYDWEFQVQLNYFFGGGLGRRSSPNYQ